MNYREKRGAYLNCEKKMFSGVGRYQVPELEPVQIDLGDNPKLIGFNYAIGEKHPEDKIVHFYLDDYQFERVWNDPERYVPILRRFKAVLAPDFSMYMDFPKAVQIFNHYRKQWCAAYWQLEGIPVIPTIGWSDEESFSWCFDGVPKHSLVCISTVGGFGNHGEHNKKAWLAGYEKCLEVLDPSEILLFGKHFPEVRPYGIMRVAANEQLRRKATLSAKPVPEGGEDIPVISESEERKWVEEVQEVE